MRVGNVTQHSNEMPVLPAHAGHELEATGERIGARAGEGDLFAGEQPLIPTVAHAAGGEEHVVIEIFVLGVARVDPAEARHWSEMRATVIGRGTAYAGEYRRRPAHARRGAAAGGEIELGRLH